MVGTVFQYLVTQQENQKPFPAANGPCKDAPQERASANRPTDAI